ncbi:hypothetical protein FSP39_001155 [Pinctada imbricata]|uniref:Uncharacterized protein n=1 Tax=Pinctada imbricata TaxID=66713 RepID=A0AA88XR07_PINIB|nr:hypothetical protein FSP39_001155 [Pinctada imbricata]
MERRRMRPFKNMLARGDPDYYKQISKCIKNGNKEMFTSLLTELNTNGQSEKLATYDEGEGETLLHVAVKYQDDNYFVEYLINECPLLLKKAREMSSDFHGQTPLHVAITKGNLGAVSLMIEKSGPVKTDLLHTCATGKRFVNTVMMGELPLTVAALKGNFEIVDILIENEADLSRQNHHGDTVFHSLIKYAAIYPEKITPVLNMMSKLNHLIEGLSNDRETADDPDRDVDDPNCFTYTYHFSYIWFLQNHECLTPLQLAAKHGLSDIFEYILNIKDVYCILSTHDGLFDVKQYDISEIDTVCNHKTYHNQKALTTRPSVKISPDRLEGVGKKNVTESDDCLPFYQTCKPPKPESVLEMMYSSQYSSRAAFRIIELPAVKNIVKTKWKHYKTVFGSG